jgi:ATP-dependent protease HslVU (ClpYQ) peptidase subunit
MTTIAVRNGVMAADSQMTVAGTANRCMKLFRRHGSVIGVAGDDAPALLFVDWYGSGKARPEVLLRGGADFYALVLDPQKRIWLFDKWCRGELIREKFFAVGTGADLAFGAMHAGANARKAVAIACKRDINSGLPVVTMRPK